LNNQESLSSPLVSVIIVSYNHAKFILETLESIRLQTYKNLQIIVSDNSSSDNSVDIIEDWISENKMQVTFLKYSVKIGLCKILNKALKEVKGTFVQLISCDDILLPEKIEKQVSLFQTLDNDEAVIFSDAYLIDENGTELQSRFIKRAREFSKIPEGNLFETLLDGNFIPAMSTLIRTETMLELHGFDENLKYEDYDFWLRLSRKYKFKFSDFTSCKYRLHASNLHKSDALRLDYYWILKKHRDLAICLDKFHGFAFKMYMDGKTKSNEYQDYISEYGRVKGPGTLINLAIAMRIPYKYLLNINNLLKAITSKY